MSQSPSASTHKQILASTVFDSGKTLLPENRHAAGPVRGFIGDAFGASKDSSLILAKAALCVPVGGSAFFQSNSKSFIFAIHRATDSSFTITIRNNKAGVSFGAQKHVRDDHVSLALGYVKAFLGTPADIDVVIRNATLSIYALGDRLHERLKKPDAKAPFLGIAGHEKSPERAHLLKRREDEPVIWTARPA